MAVARITGGRDRPRGSGEEAERWGGHMGVTLDKEQLSAAEPRYWCGEKYYNDDRVVFAAAGSGKTLTLSAFVNALRESECAGEVCVCTFGVEATRELRRRIPEEHVTVTTLHGLALNILRGTAGLSQLSVISDEDIAHLLADVIRDLGVGKKVKVIEGMKTALKERVRAIGDSVPVVLASSVLDTAHNRCLLRKTYPIDWLIPMAASAVMRGEAKGIERIEYLVIDEAQDLSAEQWDFIGAIRAAYSPSLFVVGDPNQCIYEWRGAQPDTMASLKPWQNADTQPSVFHLTTNYRSSRAVVEAANRVIDGVKMKCVDAAPEGVVTSTMYPSAEAEAEAIIGAIKDGIGGSVAVLCRTNARAVPFIEMALRSEIPHYVMGRRYLSPHDASILTFLRFLENPHNDFYAERVLPRFLGTEEIWLMPHLSALAASNNRSVWSELHASRSPEYAAACNKMHSEFISLRPADVHISVLAAARILGIDTLILNSAVYAAAQSFDGTLGEFIRAAVIGNVLDILNRPHDGAVSIGTIHQAKGREWDVVYLIGCETGTFPSGDNIAEERRLLYVAATRAKREFHISGASSVRGWSGDRHAEVSPYHDIINGEAHGLV